jgi:hypothetical protein
MVSVTGRSLIKNKIPCYANSSDNAIKTVLAAVKAVALIQIIPTHESIITADHDQSLTYPSGDFDMD